MHQQPEYLLLAIGQKGGRATAYPHDTMPTQTDRRAGVPLPRLKPPSRTASLRATLVAGIGLLLLASLLVGSVLLYWHAVRKVDVEMRAAVALHERMVHKALSGAEQAADPLRQIQLLVADLDGDRYLKAMLTSANGTLLARSSPFEPTRPAPQWFFNLLAPQARVARIQISSPTGLAGTIVLETDSRNEIAEVWSDVILTFTVLTLFCVVNAVLVFWVTGRALRPVDDVIRAFGRIGSGDYSVRLPERGPLEMKQVSSGFNRMVDRLAEMQVREGRLEDQLAAVQEEERVELAQDLHDEVGPLLFAVSVDLSALRDPAILHPDPGVRARLTAMQDAIGQIQRHVKAILERLRPPTVADLGLLHSIERIVAFWRTRYPTVAFRVNVPEEPVDTDIAGRIVRITQESISNALRHGNPDSIEIDVTVGERGATTVQIRDDGAGLQAVEPVASWGLRGIRNQVDSAGGVLTMTPGPEGRGVMLSAQFPAPQRGV